MEEKIRVSLGGASAEPLNVKLNSVVSGGKVTMPLPTIVQNTGLPEDDAMVFIKDLAEGKRKIARALTQKYEPTNEYETFDAMAEKIKTLPLEIREDIPQPYFVVFNEMQKAFAKYGGEGVYCCAVELTKWDYDKNDTISLSGASAYYTSEGKYVTQGGEYQFNDLYADNAMRYVIYFFDHKDYTIPLNLNPTAVTNIYCLNGCPRFPIGNLYTNLCGIYSYTRDKYTVVDKNDLYLYSLSYLKTLILCGIEEMKGGKIESCTYARPNMPDLKRIDGGSQIFIYFSYWYEFGFPNLEYVKTNYLPYGDYLRTVIYPKLKKAEGTYWLSNNTATHTYLYLIDMPELEEFNVSFAIGSKPKDGCIINVPKLRFTNGLFKPTTIVTDMVIKLGNPVGGKIKILLDATATTNNTISFKIEIQKGFASELNLWGCNGLERDVLLGIINNLANLTGTEYEDKLELILGSTLYNKLTDDDRLIATNKRWVVK